MVVAGLVSMVEYLAVSLAWVSLAVEHGVPQSVELLEAACSVEEQVVVALQQIEDHPHPQ